MVTLAHDAGVGEYLRRDWMDVVRSGGAVKRCHTHPIVGEYRVDAHSWGVAVLIHRLDPNASKGLILAALFHDVAEKWTGDVPADAKWREPGLKALLDRVEEDVAMELDIGFEALLTPDEKLTLSIADRLELMWFCLEQRRLGNVTVDLIVTRVLSWFETLKDRMSFPAHALLRDVRGHYEKLAGAGFLATETTRSVG